MPGRLHELGWTPLLPTAPDPVVEQQALMAGFQGWHALREEQRKKTELESAWNHPAVQQAAMQGSGLAPPIDFIERTPNYPPINPQVGGLLMEMQKQSGASAVNSLKLEHQRQIAELREQTRKDIEKSRNETLEKIAGGKGQNLLELARLTNQSRYAIAKLESDTDKEIARLQDQQKRDEAKGKGPSSDTRHYIENIGNLKKNRLDQIGNAYNAWVDMGLGSTPQAQALYSQWAEADRDLYEWTQGVQNPSEADPTKVPIPGVNVPGIEPPTQTAPVPPAPPAAPPRGGARRTPPTGGRSAAPKSPAGPRKLSEMSDAELAARKAELLKKLGR